MKDTTSQGYWNIAWDKRIKPDGIYRNCEKADILLKHLWNRPQYLSIEKLEIGCGPGTHILSLAQFAPNWGATWTGIDLSDVVVKCAVKQGLNAKVASIETYETNRKFGVFLLLDVLEHIKTPKIAAKKIKGFADDKYAVFGNVPLFYTEAEGFEIPVDFLYVRDFLSLCGCKKMWHEIYGVDGYPFMVFEGIN